MVDDEDDARQLVKAILETCGCRVRVAGAMVGLADEAPDVMISDVGMPEHDGYS